MGDVVSGLFGGPKTTESKDITVDPWVNAQRGALWNSIGKNQLTDLATQMYQSAVAGYNPQRYNDIFSKYSDISKTGFQPQIQAYIDAITKAGTNEWNTNVMPNVIEKTRGYGAGSVIPESIAKAGQNFYTNLAGTMAGPTLQAAELEAKSKLAGTEGMAKTATESLNAPGNLASDMMRNLLLFANLQGGGNISSTSRTSDPVGSAVNAALISAGLLKSPDVISGLTSAYNWLFPSVSMPVEDTWSNVFDWGSDVMPSVTESGLPSDWWL